jgi:AsmA-like C-terminal region/Protein of unknown function
MKKTAVGADVVPHQESQSETEAPGLPDGQSEMPMAEVDQVDKLQQRQPNAPDLVQQQGQPVSPDQKQQQGQSNVLIRKIIFRFLAGWLASIVLLIVIAFSADIDWAKPFLQRGLSIIIHRNVTLGHLSWFWRPGNLTIETTRVSITDNFGAKLLITGPSQVGLAFFPLLKKNVVIKHITLSKPEFWAVRMKDKAWNFDDLLTLGPDIQFIQTDRGIVHVVDGVDINHPKWQQLTFQNVNLKFLFPRTHADSPLYISANLVRPTYNTKVIFTCHGGGSTEWKTNKYKFDTIISHLNLDDVAPFLSTVGNIKPPPSDAPEDSLHGLFNVQMSGEGIYDKGLTANVKVSSEKFSLDAAPFGVVSAPAESYAQIVLDKQKLRWHDMVVKLANLQLHSSGEIADWKNPKSKYDATVTGNIKDLEELKEVIEKPESLAARKIVGLENFQISGQANVTVSVDKTGKKKYLVTTFSTKGLQVKPFLDQSAKHLSPILKLLGLQDNALLTGKMEYTPDERLQILEGSMPFAGGELKTNGTFDLRKSTSHLNFESSNIQMRSFSKNVEAASNDRGLLSHFFHVSKGKHLELGGQLNASGTLDTQSDLTVGEGSGTFKNAVLAINDGSLNARQMSGEISWHDRKLRLTNLHGTVGNGGAFTLEGLVNLKGLPFIDWTIKSKHLDLEQLSALMKLMRIDVPLFSQNHLTGTVRSLDLKVTGPRDKPNISFTAVPENMFYKPPGLTRPLKAIDGVIAYKNDNLSLKNVAFVTGQDQVKATFTIEQLSHAAKLSSLQVSTDGIDLADVNYYLSSSLMPKPLKKVYLNFLKEATIFDVHGRTSAGLTCKFQGEKVFLDGTAKLDDVEAKVMQPGMLVKNIHGEVTASGEDLTFKNVRGSFRDADVFFSGKVLQYSNDDPTYQVHIKASLKPEELLEMMPPARVQLEKWHLTLHSEHSVDVNSDFVGNNKSNNLKFSLKASPAAKLQLSSRFGDIYQPPTESLGLDGLFISNPQGIKIKDAEVKIGSSTIKIEGEMGAPTTESIEGRPLRIEITSLQPVTVAHLLSTLDPTIKLNDITGHVSGKILVEGIMPDLAPSGEVALSQISIPSWNVHGLNGKVTMSGKNKQPDMIQPIAELSIPSLNIGPLTARNCKVDLALDAPADAPSAGLIRITGANADIVGGTAELSGNVDLRQRDMQMIINLTKVSAAEVTEKMFKLHNQISGDVDMQIKLGTHGKNLHEVLTNFAGDGNIEISNGSIRKMGRIETDLRRVTLLHQGLVGLNWNSFWESIIAKKTGTYKTLTGEFKFDRQLFTLEQFKYSGADMCLWAAGTINLRNSIVNMTVAGDIPRISKGTVAGVSRAVRLTSFLNVATLGRLKSFPSLPILGEINPDRSRTFEFKLKSPVDEPKAITQSAERTFRWLPSRPTASAHPVLALE